MYEIVNCGDKDCAICKRAFEAKPAVKEEEHNAVRPESEPAPTWHRRRVQ